MRTSRLGGTRGIVVAALLTLVAALLAWTCLRAAAGNMLAEGDPTLVRALPGDPEAVLSDAAARLVSQYGRLDPATLAAVRRAATAVPLDARPYLILGHQQLLDRTPERALATLEAGQRLDPRQPLIHVLLLDRYLRTGRFAAAAAQMSVLTRVRGATNSAIATAFAAMALSPQTRGAVLRTLADDPDLERSVLVTLSRAAVPPAAIFGLATPAALAGAGDRDSWGPVLVGRLVAERRYAEARAAWARVARLGPAATAPAIFDAAFRPSGAPAPFNWTLASGSLGAADLRGGGLSIDYYGRDSGELADQMVVLPPGRHRFAVTVDPGTTGAGARLVWSIACAVPEGAAPPAPLATLPVTAGASPRRLAVDFAVPAGCPAQLLSLRGEAGDLPAPVTLTFRSPAITPAVS